MVNRDLSGEDRHIIWGHHVMQSAITTRVCYQRTHWTATSHARQADVGQGKDSSRSGLGLREFRNNELKLIIDVDTLCV